MVQHSAPVVDLRNRNPKRGSNFHDLGGGSLSSPVPHNLVPLLHPLIPRRSQRPGRILFEEIGTPDHHQEGLELLMGVGIETNPAVGRRLDRRQFSHSRWSRYRWTAGEGVVQVDESAGAEMAGFHQRTVDDLAAASGTGAQKRSHRTNSRITTQDPFEDAAARLQWRLVRPGPQTHGLLSACNVNSVAGLSRYGPVRPNGDNTAITKSGDRQNISSWSIRPGTRSIDQMSAVAIRSSTCGSP